MSDDPERELLSSWEANATPWTAAVRAGKIASRERGTNQAILDAIERHAPTRVLDLGCGEGWLVRALSERGIDAMGIDGSPALIEAAQQAGGRFVCVSYEQLAGARALIGEVELAVANFALLGKDLEPCLRDVAGLLGGSRRLLIQTLHPLAAGPPYRPSWRRESFSGFGDASTSWAAMPWYFRPVGAWVELLRHAGFVVERVVEPLDELDERPLSMILDARVS